MSLINGNVEFEFNIFLVFRFGFSGEFSPRHIIPTSVACKKTKTVRKICDYVNEQDLYDLLVEFIHAIYFKYALVSPKDRPVVIVESVLCPTQFRETLAKVPYSKLFILENM